MKISQLITVLKNAHLEAVADLEVLVKVDDGDHRPIEEYVRRSLVGDRVAVILSVTTDWSPIRKKSSARKVKP